MEFDVYTDRLNKLVGGRGGGGCNDDRGISCWSSIYIFLPTKI